MSVHWLIIEILSMVVKSQYLNARHVHSFGCFCFFQRPLPFQSGVSLLVVLLLSYYFVAF